MPTLKGNSLEVGLPNICTLSKPRFCDVGSFHLFSSLRVIYCTHMELVIAHPRDASLLRKIDWLTSTISVFQQLRREETHRVVLPGTLVHDILW